MTKEAIKNHITQVFSFLVFEEQKHLYFWKGVKVPLSVSGLVKKYVEPFNEKLWAPICAKKEGISVHEMIHKWQTTNIKACELGTQAHNFLEFYDGLKTASIPQEEAGIKYLRTLLNEKYTSKEEKIQRRYDILFKELRMYSKKFNFAGTADLILYDNLTETIVIADYKTNKDLFKRFGHLIKPFDYLESHPFNHYQLQLSYYQILLEEAINQIDIKISARNIIYLMADGTYREIATNDFKEPLLKELNLKIEYAA